MNIHDILDTLAEISIYYYSKFKCDQNLNYDSEVYYYMQSQILNLYHDRDNLDSAVIPSIRTFDSILPYSYKYMLDNNTDKRILKEKIIKVIQDCIDDKLIIIFHDYPIISIDTYPTDMPLLSFDYIGLTHDFIVNTLDIYFYKIKQTN